MSLLVTQVRIKAELLLLVINPQKKKSPIKMICAFELLTTIFERTGYGKFCLCFFHQVKSGEKLLGFLSFLFT